MTPADRPGRNPWRGFTVTAYYGRDCQPIAATCNATGRTIAKRRGPGWYVDPEGARIPVANVQEARRVAAKLPSDLPAILGIALCIVLPLLA